MWDFIAQPFGVIMKFIYEHLAFCNYGLTIIIFTIFVKLLLFPLNLKQQKSTVQTQKIQPELEALKATCGDDKELYMQEQQKLYAKYNVNPMAGCLPTLVQLPILIVVYNIIVSPLKYIASLSTDIINQLSTLAELSTTGTAKANQLQINTWLLNNLENSKAIELLNGAKPINMSFLKYFDLGATPSAVFKNWSWSGALLLLIPVLTLASQYFLQWMTSPNKNQKKKTDDPTTKSMGMMMKVMPLMTFFIALTTPAGLGFYWMIGNLLTILQTFIMNKFFIKKDEI